MRQIGNGVLQHVTAQQRFPTGGWGYNWVGDPDQGFSKNQPGGWIYNILPYMDQINLHDLGAGDSTTQRSTDYMSRIILPLPVFICGTRRLTNAYPSNFTPYCIASGTSVTAAARSDYAANQGDSATYPTGFLSCEPSGGPASASAPSAVATNWNSLTDAQLFSTNTGISYQQSLVLPAHLIDGTTYTYLVGEKSMNPDGYTTGTDPYDSRNMYVGIASDISRTTDNLPLQDIPGVSGSCSFGSAHPNAVNFVMCDGSVRPISYRINGALHASLGNRADQMAIDDAMLKF